MNAASPALRETSRGQIMGLRSGMMKLIFSMETRRLLGAHIIGEGATELIHIGQAVLNLKGTIEFFIENTFKLPDARRGLQDRRARRVEPDGAALRGGYGAATPRRRHQKREMAGGSALIERFEMLRKSAPLSETRMTRARRAKRRRRFLDRGCGVT